MISAAGLIVATVYKVTEVSFMLWFCQCLKYVVITAVSAQRCEITWSCRRVEQILFFLSVGQYLFCFLFPSISRRVEEEKECVQGGWKKMCVLCKTCCQVYHCSRL